MRKIKCTGYRLVDGLECPNKAKYEVVFVGRHVGYVCGIHARAYTDKALKKL